MLHEIAFGTHPNWRIEDLVRGKRMDAIRIEEIKELYWRREVPDMRKIQRARRIFPADFYALLTECLAVDES